MSFLQFWRKGLEVRIKISGFKRFLQPEDEILDALVFCGKAKVGEEESANQEQGDSFLHQCIITKTKNSRKERLFVRTNHHILEKSIFCANREPTFFLRVYPIKKNFVLSLIIYKL